MLRRGAERLFGYGDLTLGRGVARGNRANHSDDANAQMADGGTARPDSGMARQTGNHVTTAQGKAVRYRW